jgi:hypothetical protein
MPVMISEKGSVTLVLRLSAYLAFGAMLWLKFRANHTTQKSVVTVLLMIGVVVLNYYCGRFLWSWARFSRSQTAMARFSRSQTAIHVARSTTPYVLFMGILGVAVCDVEFTVCAVRFLQGETVSQEIMGVAWLAGFIGGLFAWVGAYELRTTNETVDYFSLIGGHKTLTLRDIKNARVRSGWFTYADRFRPTTRLEILPTDRRGLRPIIVNLKVFRESDLKRFFAWLGEKLRADGQADRR